MRSPLSSSFTYGRGRSPTKRPNSHHEEGNGVGGITVVDLTSTSDEDSIKVIDLRSLSDGTLSSPSVEHLPKHVKPNAIDWITAQQCLTDLVSRVSLAVSAGASDDVVEKAVIAGASDDVVEKAVTAGASDDVMEKAVTYFPNDDVMEQAATAGAGDDIVKKAVTSGAGDDIVKKAVTAGANNDIVEKAITAGACDAVVEQASAAGASDSATEKVVIARASDDVMEKAITADAHEDVVEQAATEDANDYAAEKAVTADASGDVVEKPITTGDGEGEVLSKDAILASCIAALKLCIQRFPLHYKSYFRLAKTFLHDKQRKDLDKVQDLLLGNTAKRKEDKFVSQGLFQDRKHNNFFNGVWRIPVEEIERAGSFGAHLYKTIYLLLQFLHEKRDYHLLYQLHMQLNRTPDLEKKFLRDADRLLLSSKAMEFAIHSLYKVIGSDTCDKGEYNYAAALHQAFKWYNYCNKNEICVPNAQVLLLKAYKAYKQALDQETEARVPIADAKEFCQQMFSARSKDKGKSANCKQAAGLDLTPTRTTNSPLRQGRGASSTLLPVRGSLQSPDSEKSKIARVLISGVRTDEEIPSEGVTNNQSSKVEAQATTKHTLAEIPKTSWLNKAKEGTTALASMFERPKTLPS